MKLRKFLKPLLWPIGLYKKTVAPFNHDPENFKLKIVPAWFSSDYVSFQFSANGGESWETIYCASPPYLGLVDYDWEWKPLAYRLNSGSTFKHEKEKFSSYQKILDYEANELKKFKEGQVSINKQRKDIADRKKAIWDNINS